MTLPCVAHSCSSRFWQVEQPEAWNHPTQIQFQLGRLQLVRLGSLTSCHKAAILGEMCPFRLGHWQGLLTASLSTLITQHYSGMIPISHTCFLASQSQLSLRGHSLLEYKSESLPYSLQGLFTTLSAHTRCYRFFCLQ